MHTSLVQLGGQKAGHDSRAGKGCGLSVRLPRPKFMLDHGSPDPGKNKERDTPNPTAQAEWAGKAHSNDHPSANKNYGERTEHAHAIEKDEREVVCSQDNQERGIKQVQFKFGNRDQQEHGDGDGKCDLHGKVSERVLA